MCHRYIIETGNSTRIIPFIFKNIQMEDLSDDEIHNGENAIGNGNIRRRQGNEDDEIDRADRVMDRRMPFKIRRNIPNDHPLQGMTPIVGSGELSNTRAYCNSRLNAHHTNLTVLMDLPEENHSRKFIIGVIVAINESTSGKSNVTSRYKAKSKDSATLTHLRTIRIFDPYATPGRNIVSILEGNGKGTELFKIHPMGRDNGDYRKYL